MLYNIHTRYYDQWFEFIYACLYEWRPIQMHKIDSSSSASSSSAHTCYYIYTRVEKAGRSMQRRYERIDWSQNVWRGWRYCGNHYQQNIPWCDNVCILKFTVNLWPYTEHNFCKVMALNWLPEVTKFVHSFTYPSAHYFLNSYFPSSRTVKKFGLLQPYFEHLSCLLCVWHMIKFKGCF